MSFLDTFRCLMRRSTVVLLTTLSVVVAPLPSDASSVIASWNIEHLGWDNGKDMSAVSLVGSQFDLIAVQEVMSEDGAEALRASLESQTGTDWDMLVSEAVGRGSYREHYAFVWRTDTIEWVDGAVVYLDDTDVFAREPFAARFRTADGFTFVMTSVHLVYGDGVAERQAEAVALRSFRLWLDESFPGTPVFLSGDFNLAPDDEAWHHLADLAVPLITEGKTTISPVDGRFANLYDNIWAPVGHQLPIIAYGRLEFPNAILGIDHETARDTVSDHIPVWMQLDVSAGYVAYEASIEPEVRGAAEPLGLTVDKVATGIIGNVSSGIYHLQSCPGYARTSAKNSIPFESEHAAISGGYRRAKNC